MKCLSNFPCCEQDNGESNSEAAPLSPDPTEDEEPATAYATSNCYTQTTPEDRNKLQDSQRRKNQQYLNFPPHSNPTAAEDNDDDSGNGDGGDDSSFEVRPLIHPQKPTDITITVRLLWSAKFSLRGCEKLP